MNNNNSAFTGQVMAQNTLIGNHFGMTYQQVSVPGRHHRVQGGRRVHPRVVCQNPANSMC